MSETDENKLANGLHFVLQHMKDQEISLLMLQVELHALKDCSLPAADKDFQEARKNRLTAIKPTLDALASSYEAIILDMKAPH
jgi:hypothetical protein